MMLIINNEGALTASTPEQHQKENGAKKSSHGTRGLPDKRLEHLK